MNILNTQVCHIGYVSLKTRYTVSFEFMDGECYSFENKILHQRMSMMITAFVGIGRSTFNRRPALLIGGGSNTRLSVQDVIILVNRSLMISMLTEDISSFSLLYNNNINPSLIEAEVLVRDGNSSFHIVKNSIQYLSDKDTASLKNDTLQKLNDLSSYVKLNTGSCEQSRLNILILKHLEMENDTCIRLGNIQVNLLCFQALATHLYTSTSKS